MYSPSCGRIPEESLNDLVFRSMSSDDIPKVELDFCKTLSVKTSPRKEKDEITEVKYIEVVDKLRELSLYYYNVDDRTYMGPLTDEWNKCYPIDTSRKVLIGTEKDGELVGEEKVIEVGEREIENVDVMGVCLASLKGLISRLDDIEARIKSLEDRLDR